MKTGDEDTCMTCNHKGHLVPNDHVYCNKHDETFTRTTWCYSHEPIIPVHIQRAMNILDAPSTYKFKIIYLADLLQQNISCLSYEGELEVLEYVSTRVTIK